MICASCFSIVPSALLPPPAAPPAPATPARPAADEGAVGTTAAAAAAAAARAFEAATTALSRERRSATNNETNVSSCAQQRHPHTLSQTVNQRHSSNSPLSPGSYLHMVDLSAYLSIYASCVLTYPAVALLSRCAHRHGCCSKLLLHTAHPIHQSSQPFLHLTHTRSLAPFSAAASCRC